MDPVGAYGEGVRQVYSRLSAEGVAPLDILLYEGVRHEAFSDTDREAIFGDLVAWLNATVLKKESRDA
jgi:alpha-beta hydrolase superfamily lysophospholipase